MVRVEKPSAGSVWALALTICLLTFPQGATRLRSVDAHQGAGAIVEDSRPVAKAMALLSRQLGWNITYEEPVYVNADDLFVVKNKNGDRRTILPRKGLLRLPDEGSMARAQEDPVAFLESVIGNEETSRGRVKRFKLLRSESMFHVVPDKVLDAAGRWQTAVPTFDTEITISHGAVNLTEFFEILCANLSAVGPPKVITATLPRGPVAQTMLPAQERTARVRTLLVEALSKTQVPLKWMLMYDPSSATYYLSICPPGAF
jgi:hypothetical protein